MKTTKYLLALGLTLSSAFAFAGNGDVGSGDATILKMSCELLRSHMDKSNNFLITENLTPANLQPKLVSIFKGDGEASQTKYYFKVKTKDGVIEVRGVATAVDLLNSEYHVVLFTGFDFIDKEISVTPINNLSNKKFYSYSDKEVNVELNQTVGIKNAKTRSIDYSYTASCKVVRD